MKRTLLLFALLMSAGTHAQSTQPFAIGNIITSYSVVLSEDRILNIYLPEGYNDKDTTHYSVIYLLDGSSDEDFIHIAGLVQFCNFDWVNVLPRSIVVGIANTDRQRDLTSPISVEDMTFLKVMGKTKKDFPRAGGSEKFMDYIQKEVIPYIEKNYRTSGDRMLIGQSLGGLFATEFLFKRPRTFSKYLIVSPSLWWNNESLLTVPADISSNKQLSVFVAVGGKEEKGMIADAKKLSEILQKQNIKTTYLELPKRSHADILHEAVYKGFENFNGK